MGRNAGIQNSKSLNLGIWQVCVCVHIQIQSPLAFFVHALRYVVWLFAFVEFRFRMLNHGLAMIYIDKHYGNPT